MSHPKLIFDLSKATIDKSKLVAKQVQVTRGGKTFTQTVWVNPNQNSSTQPNGKAFDFTEFDKLKSDKVKALQYLKDCGITWQEHSHAGVNWMRACMAAKQAAGISNNSSSASQSSSQSSSSVPTSSVKKLDYQKLTADGYDNLDAKKKVASIKKQINKDEFVSLASKITSWTTHSNPAINLMRASMALSSWCETHSLDDLSTALGNQATGVQSAQAKQPDKPVDPPKPKEELEIQPNHTERQKNLINIINTISDEKALKDYASAGMVPEDDTAKSFIVDRLLAEYNTHIRPNFSGTGRRRKGYFGQRELRKEFAKMTTKLYKGIHEKIVTGSVGSIVDEEMLYDFVDPRNGVQINLDTKKNYGKNTVMSAMIYDLQRDFGGYYNPGVNGERENMLTSLQVDWDIEESKKLYDPEKDGFVMALKRVGEFDPSLKSQTDEMLETYDSMMQIVSYNPRLFNKMCDFTWNSFERDLERETVSYYKKKLIIEEMRKHGLSDDDIVTTISRNQYAIFDKAEAWPLYRKVDGHTYYGSSSEPILDDNGNEVTIDLTKLSRPDTGEMLWTPGDRVFGWSSGIRASELRTAVTEKQDFDKPTSEMTALKSITPDMYDKFSKLQRKLYGVQLQDSNSQVIVDTEPHTWSYDDLSSFRAIKDGDNEELDAVITNLSFIINVNRINYGIASDIWQSRNSAANKNGEDFSGNFTYHGYDFGTRRTKGNNPQHISVDEKRAILKQQLDDIPLFTKDELTTLRDYVNNNGDPTLDSSSYYYPASETLSRIKSLSPNHQGWQGIKGTPIDDIFMRYIEASIQYCPQIYNTRVKDKKDMKKWLYKQTGFTPYQPPQASAQQPTTSGTKLYELRKLLFDKVHCSIRTATPQEYTDITHKVKMDFDYVDPKTGKRVPKADRAYDNRALALHGNVYIINNSEAQDNFQKEAARLNETPVQMYHGTSYGGGCGIVGVDGKFMISGKETTGLQTSGAMLGQGIYMAKLVGKALPYLGNGKYSYSSYNIASQTGTTQGYKADGCLLVCDTVLGKHYHSNISTSDAAYHNDGTYDSVSVGAGAQMGGSTLKEYECVVRRNNQVAPKYIVDCGGRVR
jgi:hypothetical protein